MRICNDPRSDGRIAVSVVFLNCGKDLNCYVVLFLCKECSEQVQYSFKCCTGNKWVESSFDFIKDLKILCKITDCVVEQ